MIPRWPGTKTFDRNCSSCPFFQIPKKLQETRGYPALSKVLKAKAFGLNAAKLFKVDVEAKRKDVPKDYLSHIKMAYLEENPSPSHHAYGWVR